MAEKLDLPRPSALTEVPFGGTFSILGDEPAGEGQDRLGFGRFADRLAKRLLSSVEHTPFTVGVLGDWGQGKTTVMRMLQAKLRAEGCPTVWFEPWKYNDRDEVWKGLALTLVREIRANDNLLREMRRKRGALTRFSAAALWSRLIGDKWGTRLVEAVTSEPWSAAALHEMESTLDDLFHHVNPSGKGRSLVLFVDDLDRCLPETARSVLEAVKLVLARKGVITVLGIAEGELARAVQAAYAESMKGSGGTVDPRWGYRYIEKIIQMPFPLPQVSEVSLETYVGHCLEASGVGELLGGREEWRGVIREACGANLRNVKRFLNHFISEWDKARANFEALADEGRGGPALEVRPARVAFVLLLAFGFPEFHLHLRRSLHLDLLVRYQAYFLSLDEERSTDVLQDPGKEFHLDAALGAFFHSAMRGADGLASLVREFRNRRDLLPYLQFGLLRAEETRQETESPTREVGSGGGGGGEAEVGPAENATDGAEGAETLQPADAPLHADATQDHEFLWAAADPQPASPRALAAVSEAQGLLASGRYQEAEHALRRALRRLDEEGDEAGRSAVLCALGEALLLLGDELEATKVLRESIQLAREAGDAQVALSAYLLLIEGLSAMADNDGALEVAEQGERLATHQEDPFSRSRIVALRARVLEKEGRFAEARDAYLEVHHLAEEVAQPTLQAEAQLGAGRMLGRLGKFEAADAELRRAADMAAAIGLADIEVAALELAVDTALALNQSSAALERQMRVTEVRRTMDDSHAFSLALFELAWHQAKAGRKDDAWNALSRGLEEQGSEEPGDADQAMAYVWALEELEGPGSALRTLERWRLDHPSLGASAMLAAWADGLKERAEGNAAQRPPWRPRQLF